MEATQKILTISPSPWCDEAAAFLASTIRGAPCFTVEDYRRELAAHPTTRLFRVSGEAGELVGFVLLRLEQYAGGNEGVIVAAAGRLRGAALYGQILPALERLFSGVKTYRVEACRSGAVRELMKAGYAPTHFVMRKAAVPAPAPIGCDDLLEELQGANVEARGGPDLRARPGKLHGGGGSSSSSSSQQTNQIDRRQVIDAGSVGVSSDSSTVNVNVLDQGIVTRALDLVQAGDQETGKSVASVLGFAKEVFASGLGVLDKAGKHVETQSALVAKAYDGAQGEGTQKNLLAVAAIASVVIVAVKVWGK